MATQNLGNAAFFASKKLEKKIQELEQRIERLEKNEAS
jgi:hypothetical protein